MCSFSHGRFQGKFVRQVSLRLSAVFLLVVGCSAESDTDSKVMDIDLTSYPNFYDILLASDDLPFAYRATAPGVFEVFIKTPPQGGSASDLSSRIRDQALDLVSEKCNLLDAPQLRGPVRYADKGLIVFVSCRGAK